MSQTLINQEDGGALTTQGLTAIKNNFADIYAQVQSNNQLGATAVDNLPGSGFVNKQLSAAGMNPGATGADNVLAVFSLPANALAAAGNGVIVTAYGQFGATGNNKRVKIIFNPATAVVGSTVGAGGTTIADTGTVATNAGGFSIEGSVFKYGAAGSNTQIGLNDFNLVAGANEALVVPAAITATENAAILIAVTGNATTVVGDISLNAMIVEATN